METDECLYYGFKNTEKFFGRIVPSGEISVIALESEKKNHAHIKYWLKINENNPIDLYRNFQKEYSFVWKPDHEEFLKQNKNWVESAIWFYTECLNFPIDNNIIDFIKETLEYLNNFLEG